MSRKALIVAATLVQVIAFGALLGWQVRHLEQVGWAGFAYAAELPEGAPSLGLLVPLVGRGGAVLLVAPGSPAARAGITPGDRVIAIEGVAPADVKGLGRLARRARRGDTIQVRLGRGGTSREVALTLVSPFSAMVSVIALLSSIFVGAISLLISVLVFWSRPGSRQAFVFYLVCAVGAAAFFAWGAAEPYFPDLRGVLPLGVGPGYLPILGAYGLLSILLANLLLHFALIFPKVRPVLHRWPTALVWLHTLPFLPVAVLGAIGLGVTAAAYRGGGPAVDAVAVVAASGASLVLGRAARRRGVMVAAVDHPLLLQAVTLVAAMVLGVGVDALPGDTRFVFGMLAGIGGLLAVLGAVLVVTVLTAVALHRSYREADCDEAHQIRWPMWGTIVYLLGALVLAGSGIALAAVLRHRGFSPYAWSVAVAAGTKLLFVLVPVSFAFAILKYRLLEIDVLVRKTVVLSVLTGAGVVAYLGLAGLLGLTLVRWAGVESQTVTVLATLGAVGVLVPLRNRVQGWLEGRIYRRERSSARVLAGLDEAAEAGSPLEALARIAAEGLQKVLASRNAAVLLRPPGGTALVPVATVGLGEGAARLQLPTTSPVLAGPAVLLDVADSPAPAGEVRSLSGLDAAAVAPVRLRDEAVGLVSVGARLGREPFGEEEREFVAAVAARLAVAVERNQGMRAGREFAQAREIQEALLPSSLPHVDGFDLAARWRPAREVSGDYYDVRPFGGSRLALCIGDVAGKGVPASLLMSGVQAAFKAFARDGVDPVQVCGQIREVVARSLAGGRFVTFFYGVADRAAGTLTYVNAGHPAPLVRLERGGTRRLDRGGPAIARVFQSVPFEEETVSLENGDLLLLFTDGLTEAAAGEGEAFGEERLVELVDGLRGVAAAALLDAVAEAATTFAGGVLADDLTAVALAVR